MEFDKKINFSEDLAEIIGIMMGDGCLYLDRLNKYQTIICFHKKERDYLDYVKILFENYFQYKFCITEIKSEFLLRNTSVFVGNKLIDKGLSPGNKTNNKIVIPKWIMEDKKFLLMFIKGFFDTDGSVYCKYGNYAQIQIKLGCQETLSSIRKALIKLGFNPTKIQKGNNTYSNFPYWKIDLSRQGEIEKFFKEIKPSNPKHKKRYQKIINGDNGI